MEKDLTKLSGDELIQLHQDGVINTLQFVMAHEETSEMFRQSCILYNIEEPTNEVAEDWYNNHEPNLLPYLSPVMEMI
jgi:hypothetical protein